ncbi:MAG: OmpA family protein [Woeseiaceae bacterium]|nr:OmpA family protein [Woeseiaceae bacterium]
MRTTSIAITATVAMLAAMPSLAETRTNKHEAIGVGSGAVIGAIAGGPPGFIIGAAIGAKVGDTMHEKSERIETLQGSLTASNDRLAQLAGDVDTLTGEVERLQNVARPELVALMQAGIAMDLLFRTDEAVLSDGTGSRLAQLAQTLAEMPDIYIQLDGFADERGDEDYNLALSERRVGYIRDQFVAAGIDPDRINVTAHGESAATDATLDSYALERRVSVTLYIDDTLAVAATPSL